MRLRIRHVSSYAYDPSAERVAMRLKLFPSSFDGQHAVEWTVCANGDPVSPLLTSAFGDEEALWLHHKLTSAVEIVAEGIVETADRSGVVRGLPAAPPCGVFLRTTALTQADEAIRTLAADAACSDPLEELHAICNAVRDAVDYLPGATQPATTAAEALRIAAGVCQDHAHVFIAAARSRARPARYVAGYLLSDEGSGELHETHAWAEAYINGLGWVGFDPANRVCPTERYVRLSCGLDARDAAPIRGNVLGGGGERLHAAVAIAQAQQ